MLKDIIIRRFREDDAENISRLIIDNLLQVNVIDYGETAVAQLARFHSPDLILKYARNSETYIAELNSEIIGTATLDQNRVRNVHIKIPFQKQGIGKLLMSYIEDMARKKGQPRLELLANIAAVDFYRDLGYRRGEDKSIEVGESRITVVFMEKDLAMQEPKP